MGDADKRIHTRVQYFLIKDDNQAVPIYAFRDAGDALAIPALLIDLSDGGAQVLTTRTAHLSHQIYSMELVVAGIADDAELERAQVEKVWFRDEGINIRTGFVFTDVAQAGANWVKILKGAQHHVVRCVLHPVG
jgi:hypothetical protein